MSLETPSKIRDLQRKLYVKAKQEPDFRFYLLYDKVHREDVLRHAYALCRANGGAPGVDGMNFEAIEASGLLGWLDQLGKDLREKTYQPGPVRRVKIPKPGGGERPLGIPNIRDRVAQQAAVLILGPIFEADFADSAYGYRPKRSAQQAVEAVHGALIEGYTDIVDADLSKYFDTIPHHELMQSVARRVTDRWMLKLVKSWLKVPVSERDERGRTRITGGKKSTRGTPQGGVISPLLANIYMHRYLRAWDAREKGEEYEARIVNYADDFVILSRRKAAEALTWTRGVMTAIGLTLNETKTRLCDARTEHFDFLGYTFGPEHYRKTGSRYLAAKPSKKSVLRVKEKLRPILYRGNPLPWELIRQDVNRLLAGWAAYFSYGTRARAYNAVNQYVEERVRNFLRRRHKVVGRAIRRFSNQVIFEELGVIRLRSSQRVQRTARALS
ncbi:MAG: group II intron reverse transcriptase/maturase [Planctomycetes bacterium]|nr:group II intron reverse transcriptase/maturase [Planctomycetota bacterium]